jgi:hypothetical protein
MFEFKGEYSQEKHLPVYDMSPEKVQQLTSKLIEERAGEIPNDKRFITVEVNGDSEYSNIGRDVERRVFEAYFGNDANEMKTEYGPYEGMGGSGACRFFLSIDREKCQPTGVLRIICNSQNGLKSLNDAEAPPFNVKKADAIAKHNITDLDEVWDFGTIAVLPEYQQNAGKSSLQLCRASYISSIKNGIKHWISIVDDGPYHLFKDYLAIPFVPLGDSEPGAYLGSEKSHAVYAHVPDIYDNMETSLGKLEDPIAKKVLGSVFYGFDDPYISLED